ncbi:hypothetical protein [Roseospirillum parvum]|uniref:Uncharacterized protein n=1 Tax=Roseospirillum parvum TaxID=83401 RepID=A0A1G8C142_9PROT|nr:hypothetical protein [Roseospirillum parvum]SDH39084.1 hypothetical protein SAMN05421742_106172 [Roseospirillum parvum]
MSELMLSHMQSTLERVSGELSALKGKADADRERMLGALGDLSANSGAVMTVLAAFLKAHRLDPAIALAVLDEEEAESGIQSPEIRQRVKQLVGAV